MTYDLTGKRAIVTGASRGLGAAIAKAFEEAGANVYAPTKSSFDLSESPSIYRLWLRKGAEPVDILVNNAAIIGPVGPSDEQCTAAWRECLEVNLISPMRLCALAVANMRESGRQGSIINISGGGATSPRPNYSAYATAKCGLVRFSETLAMEVEQYGIRVNCVAPGLLNTAMGSPEGDPPERAAQLVTWLASDDSRPVTGRLISAKWDPWDIPGFAAGMGDQEYRLRRTERFAR